MKFVIYDWAGCCSKDMERIGYSHNDLIDADIFETAKIFFNAGLNVMIMRGDNYPTLAIDNKRFGQR